MTDLVSLPCMSVYAGRVPLQHWGVLRFSDHRDWSPRDIVVSAPEFSAILTRSKTLGADKNIASRPVVVDLSFHLDDGGQKLLNSPGPHSCDYLLPGPSTNLQGCTCSKMRCDTAYALFNSALGPQGPSRGSLRVARDFLLDASLWQGLFSCPRAPVHSSSHSTNETCSAAGQLRAAAGTAESHA